MEKQQQEDVHALPHFTKSLLMIPPNRCPKKFQKLKPEKWKAAFDLEGRLVGFHKLLKIIRKGGVDHSIRAEVWEFLLGCYELRTTLAYRELLRQARRERYNELLEQCRKMHSSIGTSSLAYTIGSKLMDVRVSSNVNTKNEEAAPAMETSPVKEESNSHGPTVASTDASEESADKDENLNLIVRELSKWERTAEDVQEGTLSSDDIRLQEPLPGEVDSLDTTKLQQKLEAGLVKKRTSIEIDQKFAQVVDSIQENATREESCNVDKSSPRDMDVKRWKEDERTVSAKEDSNFLKSLDFDSLSGPQLSGNAKKVTDWLWMLHRIVVDVVRTDKHLEFFNEEKNSARMSDILAVYAWVDPATGYCQGMSDLLSPFIVLFDIDADAFWCFESLLKRVRDNFQMEGPMRVMKQLEAMPKILEVIDTDILKHLVLVGADNFLFAFRMLLVLFRRELSFPEALYMWEMMWAADFHQEATWSFEYHCLEALRLPNFNSFARVFPVEEEACRAPSSEPTATPPANLERLHSTSASPSFDSLQRRALAKRRSFCGLRPARLWQFPRSHLHSTNVSLSGPDGDQDISVFCVAAIIEQNRSMLLEKLQSMDDAIKIFNNMEMRFKVHSCVNNAVKLRKQYRSQSSKHVVFDRSTMARQHGSYNLSFSIWPIAVTSFCEHFRFSLSIENCT